MVIAPILIGEYTKKNFSNVLQLEKLYVTTVIPRQMGRCPSG